MPQWQLLTHSKEPARVQTENWLFHLPAGDSRTWLCPGLGGVTPAFLPWLTRNCCHPAGILLSLYAPGLVFHQGVFLVTLSLYQPGVSMGWAEELLGNALI